MRLPVSLAGRGLAAHVLVVVAGCGPLAPTEIGTEEIFRRFEAAFGQADAAALEGLYPPDWALLAFPDESRRSVRGRELRRRLSGLFRARAPVAWRELPGSIRFTPDRSYLLFIAEWTSFAIGTDRLVEERLRVGLERIGVGDSPGLPDPLDSNPSAWRIREITIWTR